jgi:hypothetical protein
MASIDALRQKCVAAGQQHLLDEWDVLRPAEQQELAAEIQVPLQQQQQQQQQQQLFPVLHYLNCTGSPSIMQYMRPFNA